MPRSSTRDQQGPPPLPDRATLRDAALAHLARFSATEHALTQVLLRRIARWARAAITAGADTSETEAQAARLTPLAAEIARDMVALGAVDDAAFARARAQRLTRSGRSRRAVQAHLAAKGIGSDTLDEALDETLGEDTQARETELAAALAFARRRRLGPFSPEPQDDMPADDSEDEGDALRRMRILSAFARAGFARDTAEQALSMDRETAQDTVIRLKSGA